MKAAVFRQSFAEDAHLGAGFIFRLGKAAPLGDDGFALVELVHALQAAGAEDGHAVVRHFGHLQGVAPELILRRREEILDAALQLGNGRRGRPIALLDHFFHGALRVRKVVVDLKPIRGIRVGRGVFRRKIGIAALLRNCPKIAAQDILTAHLRDLVRVRVIDGEMPIHPHQVWNGKLGMGADDLVHPQRKFVREKVGASHFHFRRFFDGAHENGVAIGAFDFDAIGIGILNGAQRQKLFAPAGGKAPQIHLQHTVGLGQAGHLLVGKQRVDNGAAVSPLVVGGNRNGGIERLDLLRENMGGVNQPEAKLHQQRGKKQQRQPRGCRRRSSQQSLGYVHRRAHLSVSSPVFSRIP